MGEKLPIPVSRAISRTAESGSDFNFTAGSGSACGGWLSSAAQHLLGKDAGLHLHYITGYPERSCYYYASGERAPPAHFIYQLFHSEQGEPFFLSFMAECQARWWQEHKRALRVAAAVDSAE